MRRATTVPKNQLDLFSVNYEKSKKIDVLLDQLSSQASNVLYLRYRLGYCYDYSPKRRLELMDHVTSILDGYRDLCSEFNYQGDKYTKVDFKKKWYPREDLQITDASAFPSKEDIQEHWSNCESRFRSAKMAVLDKVSYVGPILDEIQNRYQTKNYY